MKKPEEKKELIGLDNVTEEFKKKIETEEVVAEPVITGKEAREILEQIKTKTDELNKLMERTEAIKREAAINGETEAGIPVKEETDEEREIREVNEWLKGTGLSI